MSDFPDIGPDGLALKPLERDVLQELRRHADADLPVVLVPVDAYAVINAIETAGRHRARALESLANHPFRRRGRA